MITPTTTVAIVAACAGQQLGGAMNRPTVIVIVAPAVWSIAMPHGAVATLMRSPDGAWTGSIGEPGEPKLQLCEAVCLGIAHVHDLRDQDGNPVWDR